MYSYLPEDDAAPIFEAIGFDTVEFVEEDGAQAYLLRTKEDCLVVCRGTEPNEWNDIKADANAVLEVAETVGKVHRGFKREVDDLWPPLEKALAAETRQVWFTGHSLGGAMATICAGRCYLSHIPIEPVEVQTFGSPRVGNKEYVNYAGVRHLRWVNNNDVVTRVPPAWLGYTHTGVQRYFNTYGQMRRLAKWQRVKDRWRGFIAGLKVKRLDHFSDHAIASYVENVAGLIEVPKKR